MRTLQLWSAVKCRAVNFSASVTLTSSDLFALWLPASCIGRDRQDESCPESIQPSANGSHHTPVSLHVRSLWTWPTSPSPTTTYTTIIITITVLPASADRPWHPAIWATQLFKAFIPDQRQRLVHRHRHRQQIDARRDQANEGGGVFMRNRSLWWRNFSDKLLNGHVFWARWSATGIKWD